MSALSKISKATPTKGGNNIKDGNYLYFVDKITYDERGYSGATFVYEFRVIEAASNGDTDEKKKGEAGKPTIPNTVGSSCSMVCLLDKHDNAGGNAKACALGLLMPLGYTEEQITEDLLLEISSPSNPLRGVAVRNETYRGWNKGKTNIANRDCPLTLNKWIPIAQTVEDMHQRRAWLDSNGATAAPVPTATASASAVTEVAAPVAVAAPVVQAAPVAPQPAPAPAATSPLLARLGVK